MLGVGNILRITRLRSLARERRRKCTISLRGADPGRARERDQ